MKYIIFLITCFACVAQAATLTCDYNFMGTPMGSVVLDVTDNRPAATAQVSLFYSPKREVPVSNEPARSGEFLYLILSKQDPSNEVEMIIYPSKDNLWPSKLINQSIPSAKELEGVCRE